ncbi:YcxB family protein, partial [Candidatus Izimaplasma bacterium]|nr:YcxB family protein [Candidatus Izimaplasma bacterium]
FAIRNYLHRRSYNILILIVKLTSLYYIFLIVNQSTFMLVFNIIFFFYFEIYLLYTYFKIRKTYRAIFDGNLDETVTLSSESITHKNKTSNSTVLWDEIDYVKETRWFYFFFKSKIKIVYFFKKGLTEDASRVLREHLEDQKRAGKDIRLRKN